MLFFHPTIARMTIDTLMDLSMAMTPSLRSATRQILGAEARVIFESKLPKLWIHLFVGVGGGLSRSPSPLDPCKDVHLGVVVEGAPKSTGALRVVQ